MKTSSNYLYNPMLPLPAMLVFFLLAINLCVYSQSDKIPPEIITAISKGNVNELANHFNNTIDLNIPGHDTPCSKKQAAQILKRFFENHPVKNFKSDHQGTSHDGSVYLIGTLKTLDDKNFRVYMLIKTREGAKLIQQLQFDEE
jgi:hypothetical protein